MLADPGHQSIQVVSHGLHHHSRLIEELQPRSSGLNTPAGSPQNRHRDPWPTSVSIHPVLLAVAACIPSSLGMRFILELHADAMTLWWSVPLHPLKSTLPAPGASEGSVWGDDTGAGSGSVPDRSALG